MVPSFYFPMFFGTSFWLTAESHNFKNKISLGSRELIIACGTKYDLGT